MSPMCSAHCSFANMTRSATCENPANNPRVRREGEARGNGRLVLRSIHTLHWSTVDQCCQKFMPHRRRPVPMAEMRNYVADAPRKSGDGASTPFVSPNPTPSALQRIGWAVPTTVICSTQRRGPLGPTQGASLGLP
jgi:hypothetical protein